MTEAPDGKGKLAPAAGSLLPVSNRPYFVALGDYVTSNQKLPPGGVNAMLPNSRLAIRMGHLFNNIMTSRLMQPLWARVFTHEDGFTPR